MENEVQVDGEAKIEFEKSNPSEKEIAAAD